MTIARRLLSALVNNPGKALVLFLSAAWLAAVFADVPYLSGRVP